LKTASEPVEPDWKNPKCANPQSHDEADLCEQRRSANAAEDVVFLNKIQIALGVVGAAFLFWTLYLTRVSARATVDAANASAKMAKALPALERAYLFEKVSDLDLAWFNDADLEERLLMGLRTHDGPASGFAFVNHGKTPAIIKSIAYGIECSTNPTEPRYDESPPLQSRIVASGKGVGYRVEAKGSSSEEDGAAIKAGKLLIAVSARVVYDDIFGDEHETRFFWVHNGQTNVFAPRHVPGKEHNKCT